MKCYYYGRVDPGTCCHWCGARVGEKRGFRTGQHVFCDNHNRCKMAHARAYARYRARVTSTSPQGDQAAQLAGLGGNARKGRK